MLLLLVPLSIPAVAYRSAFPSPSQRVSKINNAIDVTLMESGNEKYRVHTKPTTDVDIKLPEEEKTTIRQRYT